MTIYDQDGNDDPNPPEIRPLIGRRVIDARVTPGGVCLFLRVEGEKVLMVRRIEATGVGAMSFKVGDIKPGFTFEFLNVIKPSPHAEAIRGMVFSGLEGNVLQFTSDTGEVFGAKISLSGVEWVRRGRVGR